MDHQAIMNNLGELDTQIVNRITREREYITSIKTGLLQIINDLQDCADNVVEQGGNPLDHQQIMTALDNAKIKLQLTSPFSQGNVDNEVNKVLNPLREYPHLRRIGNDQVDLYPPDEGLNVDQGDLPNDEDQDDVNPDPAYLDVANEANEANEDLDGGWKSNSKRSSRSRSKRSRRSKR